jgi:inner membrane protein
MDLFTQAVVGAAAGAASRLPAARRGAPSGVRAAALAGAAAALLADADVLLGDPGDPLLAQELHRHFTHALVFVPVGAALVVLALRVLPAAVRGPLGPGALWFAAFTGLATAGPLDAATGYGTHLLWPFSDARTAWNLISIVDPVASLLVTVPLAVALARARPQPALLGLGLLVLWFAFAAVQQTRVADAARALAAERGVAVDRLLVRPSFGNVVLWRALVRSGDHWYVDAVRAGLAVTIHPGTRVPTAQSRDGIPDGEAVRRLARLSDGVLVWVPETRRLGDLRFAMLPDSARPMWGLAFPDDSSPPRWFTDRTLSPEDRARFLDLLLGRAPGGSGPARPPGP